MNKTKIQQDGFDLKATEKFGIITLIHNWSQPLIELYNPKNQLDFELSYRLTMDGYVQIIGNFPDNDYSWIVAQQKRTSAELLSQLMELARLIIMKYSNDQFGTYFIYVKSDLITKSCFDSMQYYSYLELFDELSSNIESFKIIKTLREFNLNPVPSLAYHWHWITTCPKCKNYLDIIHDLDFWQCITCQYNGDSTSIPTLIEIAEIERKLEENNRQLEALIKSDNTKYKQEASEDHWLITLLKRKFQVLLDIFISLLLPS